MNMNTLVDELLTVFSSSHCFRANGKVYLEFHGQGILRHVMTYGDTFEEALIKAWLEAFPAKKEKEYHA